MVLMSSGILDLPSPKPMRRIFFGSGASMETTLTIGLPALAMMKGSPFTAFAMSFERWVLASWMLTICMAGRSVRSGLSSLDLVYYRFDMSMAGRTWSLAGAVPTFLQLAILTSGLFVTIRGDVCPAVEAVNLDAYIDNSGAKNVCPGDVVHPMMNCRLDRRATSSRLKYQDCPALD